MEANIQDFSEFRSAADYLPDLRWNFLLPDVLRLGEVSLLVAPSNTGKTAFAVRLGVSVTAGIPFAGKFVPQGLVFHVAAEAPASVMDRTIPFQSRGEGVQNYFVIGRAFDLRVDQIVHDLIMQIMRIVESSEGVPRLVTLETLILCVGDADENNPNQMTQVIQGGQAIARATGAHVMLIHHTGKDHARGGRGSSALTGAVDTEMILVPTSDDGVVEVIVTKERNLPKPAGAVFAFKIASFELGPSEIPDKPRTTSMLVLQEVDQSNRSSNQSSRKTGDGSRDIAVEAVLHALTARTGVAVPTSSIVEALPPALFGRIQIESIKKSVARVLGDLSKRPVPIAVNGPDGWRYVLPRD